MREGKKQNVTEAERASELDEGDEEMQAIPLDGRDVDVGLSSGSTRTQLESHSRPARPRAPPIQAVPVVVVLERRLAELTTLPEPSLRAEPPTSLTFRK